MSLIGGLKDKAGSFFLKKELREKKHKTIVSNLASARKIGILYHADDEATFKKVKRYVRYLKEEEGIRTIMALGFADVKEAPFYLQAKLEFDHFIKKDINWHGKPAGTTVENFINEPYDILIDLTLSPVNPLRYVLLNSRSTFKVGRYHEENEPYYDLMIDQKGEDLDQFIQQINHYLKIINNGNGN